MTPTLSYQESGAGIPLLLIHGYPLTRRMWAPQFSTLAAHARLIAPDLPGFGGSPADQAASKVEDFAAALVGLLDELGITQPAVICGFSMGGYIALAFCRAYPQRCAGLVLAATRAAADTAEGKANRDKALAQARQEGAAPIIAGMLPKLLAPAAYAGRPELVEELRRVMSGATVAGITSALQAMRDRSDSTPMLPEIAVPALVIHGSADQIIPAAEAQLVAAAIPDASFVLLEGAGHMVNMEQPEAFNRAMAQFLAEL